MSGRIERILRLGVLASGSGRTVENLVARARDGRLQGEVALVIADRPGAFVLERSRRLDVPAQVLAPTDFASPAEHSAAVFAALEARGVELLLLAGYLRKLPLPERWAGRVMNIHPALLPAFGGRGFWGHHVHEAVRRAGVKVSGCTVHFVDEEYDHGPIVLQRTVPVAFDDDAGAIAARVFEEEKEAYPQAVNLYAAGKLEIEGGRVRVAE